MILIVGSKKETDGKRLLPNFYNEACAPKYEMVETEEYLLIKIIYQHQPRESFARGLIQPFSRP